ncbi:MAG: alpha/beta fold hydrolase [Candidatus Saccharibacteria bacterium]
MRRGVYILLFLILPIGLITWLIFSGSNIIERQPVVASTTNTKPANNATTGKVVEQGAVTSYTPEQVKAIIKETNPTYTGPTPALKTQTFRYTMNDTSGKTVNVYARAYVQSDLPTSGQTPIFAFAPGTTGIDDQCAASTEVPAKRNFANYASHMAAYAAQGYAVVITDYEGMRDPDRIHHYMVGVLEGRAVLDSARALRNLSLTKNTADTSQIFVAGYSQGGHAAYWADKIAGTYAPELEIKGVIGFGPVTDVRQTLTDVTRGANILWFGPYLLYSYSDWYKETYPLDLILMPPYSKNLSTDIAKNCIDTNITYWGNKDINRVYTKDFIDAMRTGSVASVAPSFDARMVENLTANTKTSSRKLINHGKLDNVVLPSQSDAAVKRLCSLGSPVSYRQYPDATHYNTMLKSFNDTLNWMKAVRTGGTTSSECKR